MTLKFYSLVLLLATSTALTGCGGGKSNSRGYPFPHYKVTPENFISGKRFCQLYNTVGGQEYGRYVKVPKDYSDLSKGTIEVYAYSYKAFNPALPTYIYVDGGPGQNTHGFTGVLNGEVNELKFDQRGLGCSTPDTYEEYFDAKLYSTENTARDMDEIRKSYGLAQWSVYGVSYGTQPATIYASKFTANLASVVLEGVTSLPQLAHSGKYKAEKWNLVLATLSPAQKEAVRDLYHEANENRRASDDNRTLRGIFERSVYLDNGFQQLSNFLQELINADGSVNRSLLANERRENDAERRKYPTTQRPKAVDQNIMLMIDCKEFSLRTVATGNVEHDYYNGFTESDPKVAVAEYNDACDEVNALPEDIQPYLVSNYPIAKHVYYFQGSHDGATLALGAFEHWKSVPRAGSTFMLAKLGGHGPNINRMRRPSEVTKPQQELFLRAITGLPIAANHVELVNAVTPDQSDWVLFTNGFDYSAQHYLSGM